MRSGSSYQTTLNTKIATPLLITQNNAERITLISKIETFTFTFILK